MPNYICAMKSVVTNLFCGKLLRYKSFILSVDELIMALKIRVAVTAGVSLTLLAAVMRCSIIFLRCSPSLRKEPSTEGN